MRPDAHVTQNFTQMNKSTNLLILKHRSAESFILHKKVRVTFWRKHQIFTKEFEFWTKKVYFSAKNSSFFNFVIPICVELEQNQDSFSKKIACGAKAVKYNRWKRLVTVLFSNSWSSGSVPANHLKLQSIEEKLKIYTMHSGKFLKKTSGNSKILIHPSKWYKSAWKPLSTSPVFKKKLNEP